MSLNLITDRTESDVNTMLSLISKYTSGGWDSLTTAQQTAWLAGLKGAYNYTDLNRVESAVATLAELLNSLGYSVSVDVKTDWALADIPTVDDLERYRSNIAKIRAALSVFSTTPAAPDSMNNLTYEQANDIEQILEDVETLIEHIQSNIDMAWAQGIAYTGLFFKGG
ncbi:MAG: hypothetical protein H6Q60_1153 [Oscillospiraceae bacterium]|nr:hypothetical protein [Oscillospiraceae bacterium]